MADIIALFITLSWCALWIHAALSGDPTASQMWEKGTFVMTFILGYYFKRSSESRAIKTPLKFLKKIRRKEEAKAPGLVDEYERIASDI